MLRSTYKSVKCIGQYSIILTLQRIKRSLHEGLFCSFTRTGIMEIFIIDSFSRCGHLTCSVSGYGVLMEDAFITSCCAICVYNNLLVRVRIRISPKTVPKMHLWLCYTGSCLSRSGKNAISVLRL